MCIETPCPKKIKAPKIWRYSVEVYIHIFGYFYIINLALYIESPIKKWHICEAKILVKLGDAKEKKELEDSDQSGSRIPWSSSTTSLRDERMQHCRESRELRGEAFLLGFPFIVEWTLETQKIGTTRGKIRNNTKHLWERSNSDVLFPIALSLEVSASYINSLALCVVIS